MIPLINSIKNLKKKLYFTQIISENRGKRTFFNLFYEASVFLITRPDKGITGKQNFRPISFLKLDSKTQKVKSQSSNVNK